MSHENLGSFTTENDKTAFDVLNVIERANQYFRVLFMHHHFRVLR